MSTNPRHAQYRTETTATPTPPEAPTRERPQSSASEAAPRTFEPTNTGTLPPMFDTEAAQEDR